MDAHLSGDLQRALAADPRAPARRAPPRRAPRPHRSRARRRARRQPRRRPRAPDPRPREPAPGARRRARGRGRGRGRARDAGTIRAEPREGRPMSRSRGSAADPTTGATRHDRARAAPPERLDGPLEPDRGGLARRAPCRLRVECRAIAAAYAAQHRELLQPLRQDAPSRRATCGHAPRPRSSSCRRTAERRSKRSLVSPRLRRRGRLGSLPLGAMSAVAVVVIVVGASLCLVGSPRRP